MQKIRTTVKIAGKDYVISGYDTEEYVQRVGTYVNRRMSELSLATRMPVQQVAVLTAISAVDDMMKARDEVTRLRTELDRAHEEIEILKRAKEQ